ncbi:MAG: hypothetical protein LBH58_02660, partial [Tannerellaceae bacterium]|nr:hypothetical protein [Tannerellaceae bacterium]
MESQEGRIFFGIGLDNKQLQSDANRASAIIKGIGDSSVAEGARIDNTYKKIAGSVKEMGDSSVVEGARIDNAYKKIAGSVAALFTIDKAIGFAKSIVRV